MWGSQLCKAESVSIEETDQEAIIFYYKCVTIEPDTLFAQQSTIYDFVLLFFYPFRIVYIQKILTFAPVNPSLR